MKQRKKEAQPVIRVIYSSSIKKNPTIAKVKNPKTNQNPFIRSEASVNTVGQTLTLLLFNADLKIAVRVLCQCWEVFISRFGGECTAGYCSSVTLSADCTLEYYSCERDNAESGRGRTKCRVDAPPACWCREASGLIYTRATTKAELFHWSWV